MAQHRANGHVQCAVSLRADTPRPPARGERYIISEPQRQCGNCRRHDPHIGIMIHPYDTATHRNERGASPVELPSRPYRPFKKINNSNPKIYFERRAANDKQ